MSSQKKRKKKMFGKRNSMNGLVRLVTSLVLGMVICYSTMSFAQIIPGATCKAENTALSDYVEYFDGRADNGYSASTYVICPLEANLPVGSNVCYQQGFE